MSAVKTEKLACAYFFVIPALAFGILSARLPAIKQMTNLTNSQVGTLLLGLGLATLAGLFLADILIEKSGAKPVTGFAALGIMTFITAASYSSGFAQLLIFLLLTGICVGFCDVGMNALGIYLEQTHKIHCLAFLHACSGIGGAAGSITGFLFSWLALTPFWNFLIILGAASLIWPYVYDRITFSKNHHASGLRFFIEKIPFFLLFCGSMSLLCHIVEGSSGEWGSILLTSKGASQQTAALVFAFFTSGLVISRLYTDSLRYKISDFCLVFFGSLAGFFAMAVILLSPWPFASLSGYAILGFAVGPITPILFSRGGDVANISPARASAVISIFSYAGLLLLPPIFGMISDHYGLVNTLWIIAILCLCMAAGSWLLKK